MYLLTYLLTCGKFRNLKKGERGATFQVYIFWKSVQILAYIYIKINTIFNL